MKYKVNEHSQPILSREIFISELIFACSLEVTLLIRLKVEWPYAQMENGGILWESFPEIFYVMNYTYFGWVKKIASSPAQKKFSSKFIKPLLYYSILLDSSSI